MTRSILRLEDESLLWTIEGTAAPHPRPRKKQDHARLKRWTRGYRDTVKHKRHDHAAFVAIGRQLYTWLDGDERWLERLREGTFTAPWLLEVAVSPRPDAMAIALLEAPWELLADDDGPLAARADVVLGVVRRVGRAADPVPPSNQQLRALFMAASPEGQAVLNYEDEERAILDATRFRAEEVLQRIAEALGDGAVHDALTPHVDTVIRTPERLFEALNLLLDQFCDQVARRADLGTVTRWVPPARQRCGRGEDAGDAGRSSDGGTHRRSLTLTPG